MIPVYFADMDEAGEEGHRCMRVPMTVQLTELILEESGPVFSGVMHGCGKQVLGWLWQEETGQWQFREWNDREYEKGEAT